MTAEEQVREALSRLDLLTRLENTVTFLEMRTFAEGAAGGAVRYATVLKTLRESAVRSAVEGLVKLPADELPVLRAVAG